MKLIIAGSRDAKEFDVLGAVQDCDMNGPFSPHDASEVVCGEARGADREGKNWAIRNGIQVVSCPADWATHGKKAGHLRNAQMGEYATHLLAVWDGESPGTKHMIDYAIKKGLVVYVYQYKH